MKIKGQGTVIKKLASKKATTNKGVFKKEIFSSLDAMVGKLGVTKNISMDIASFSSAKDFEEQVFSILSFLRFVGKPVKWTVFSDGSHKPEQVELLKKLDFVVLEKHDWKDNLDQYSKGKPAMQPYSKYFEHYAHQLPLGRRLFYYLNYPIERPTLFLDSDILFYEKSEILEDLIASDVPGYFLPDATWGCLDSRYKKEHKPEMYQVNGGFFLFNKELEKTEKAYKFLESLDCKYEYFSDQNLFHILLLDNNFVPFDPRTFILNSGDQFKWKNDYQPSDMAIRHFTGPVRHKMWQNDWKWHLKIK